MPIPLQVVIESQAKLAGFDQARAALGQFEAKTVGVQQQITGQIKAQAAAHTQVVRQMERQRSLFASIGSGFKNAVGIGSGGGKGGFMEMAGSWAGAAAGGLVAGAAYAVVNAFKEVARSGIQLADMIGDLSEQLGLQREETMRLVQGSTYAGIPQRVSGRAMGTLGQLRGLALSGDKEALSIFETYGVGLNALGSSADSFELANTVLRSIGSEGAQPRDDAALRRLFGPRYNAVLQALRKAPAQSAVSESDFAAADRWNSAFEYADFAKKGRATRATRNPADPFGWMVAMDSKVKAFDLVFGYLRQLVGGDGANLPGRTAGTWTPARLREKDTETKQRMAAIEFSAPGAGGAARRGLFASAADYRLSMNQINISKRMLEELKEIRAALTHGLKWEET